jgi:hypothetical protein
MGLDLLDMTFQLERRFGVKMSVDRFCRASTVNDVCQWLAEATSGVSLPSCSIAGMFFRLRKHLVEHCGCAREEVRPDARMEQLFRTRRRQRWAALWKFDSRIPPLEASPLLSSLRGIGFACFAGGGIVAIPYFLPPVAFGAAVIFGLALCVGVYWLTTHLERVVPAEAKRVWDVVLICAPLPATPSQDDLMLEVRRIIADVTGLPLEKIRPESELIRDLNMG